MHATGVKPPRVCSVQVLLWDMRKPAAPFRTILPDGSPALQLLASPETEKCMAVATGVWVPQVCGCHRCVDVLAWHALRQRWEEGLLVFCFSWRHTVHNKCGCAVPGAMLPNSGFMQPAPSSA